MKFARAFLFLGFLALPVTGGTLFAPATAASKYDTDETQWIDPWSADSPVNALAAAPSINPALRNTSSMAAPDIAPEAGEPITEPVTASSAPTLGDSGFWPVIRAISTYKKAAKLGGWEQIPEGERLEPGMRDRRVLLVRKRLIATGDLKNSDGDPSLFDAPLAAGVRLFQARHGLKADAVIGRATVAAMNVPIEVRLHQLEINLRRLNDVATTLGRRYVFVNIAGQEVEAVEDGNVVIRKRVIVGKEDRQTPEYTSKITFIALNPYWNVPQSIAMKDLLPKIKANPLFLKRMGIRVFQGWGDNSREVDPQHVKWSDPNVTMRYRLRQDPSRLNSLGTVKIDFPNPYAVYLHDTPVKTLFSRQGRNFSSGCVRVEDVRDFAAWLLKDKAGWDRAKIDQTIASGERKDVSLAAPVPIYLMYLTAWVGDDGVVNFRDDVYDRDRKISATSQAD